jgi:putative RNA 2'-phosphotransferase
VDDWRVVRISKYLSLHLRHRPARLGLELAPGGWVDVEELLAAAARDGVRLDWADLEEVVARNDKRRFSFDGDGRRIRANQGHSVDVDLGLDPLAPPETLYHGTAERFVDAILATGLEPRGRHHVHLSADEETARRVGARRGRPVVLAVAAGELHREGADFFRSANGVWLVDAVPSAFLRPLE